VDDGFRATVVIPTRDRPEQLALALAALAGHELDSGTLELVVIDDGSLEGDRVAAVVAASPARLVRTERLGIAAARNAAVKAAGTDLILFIDDDCEPAPGWAEKLVRRLEDGADVAFGPTVTGRRDDPLPRAYQIVSNAPARADKRPFAPGSNLACRRELLARIPFDPGYASAEDRDWYARVAAAGVRVEFEDGAVVRHFPKLDLPTFWRKNVRYGRGASQFRREHAIARIERPRFYLRLVREGAAAGPRALGLVLLAQVATAVGFGAERLDRLRAGERQRLGG
jgi:glycosyltransferase involved in cell wall biosynthesis